jgi:hypothetical protein
MPYGRIFAKKVREDGYVFDSEQEYAFYKALQERNDVGGLIVHPIYELQPAFVKGGKSWKAINYEADFQYTDSKGLHIVDVKGMILPEFEIHRKMFEYKYPQYRLEVLKYSKTTGWVSIDDYKKEMKSKRAKLIEEKNHYKNIVEKAEKDKQRKAKLRERLIVLQGKSTLTKSERERVEAIMVELNEKD